MTTPPSALGAAEKALLLRIARRALEEELGRGEATRGEGPAETGVLAEKRGAFVTLRDARGELRGCVGFVEPRYALADAVRRAAVAAATADGRFDSVVFAELPGLHLEISVLSALTPIAPEAVEVGRHGVMIRHQGRGGLLLPQVATEHGWGREAFLEHTCRKAGLPPDAWKSAGVELLGFTAELIAEAE